MAPSFVRWARSVIDWVDAFEAALVRSKRSLSLGISMKRTPDP